MKTSSKVNFENEKASQRLEETVYNHIFVNDPVSLIYKELLQLSYKKRKTLKIVSKKTWADISQKEKY